MLIAGLPYPAIGGSALSNLRYAAARFAPDGTTGNVDYTISGLGWTPKFARITWIENSADGATAGLCRGSHGMTDGTNSWNIHWRGNYENALSRCFTGYVARNISTGDRASVVGFIENGIRLNYTLSEALDLGLLLIEFFDSDNMQVEVGTTFLAAQDAAVTLTPGFETNLLLTALPIQSFGSVANGLPRCALGYGTYDGTALNQVAVCQRIATSGFTRQSFGLARDDAVITTDGSYYTEMGTPTATEVSLTSRGGSATSAEIGYAAISFGGDAKAHVGIYDSPASAGNLDIDGADFTPIGMMLHTTRMTALDTAQTSGEGWAWSLSAITDDAAYCHHWRFSDANGSGGTNDDYSEASSVAINTSDHRSTNAMDATFVEFGEGYGRLNFSAVPASQVKIIGVLFG